MKPLVRSIIMGPIETNCWIIGCPVRREAMVVDPGGTTENLPGTLKAMGIDRIPLVVNTHGHFDHVWGNAELGVDTAIHRLDAPMLPLAPGAGASWGFTVPEPPPPARMLNDGDRIRTGDLVFTVLHTPGHSPGSICLLGHGLLLSGDTLFQGSAGRTDLPGGDEYTMRNTLARVILSLDDSLRVLPGHGPETTMRREKNRNPFLCL